MALNVKKGDKVIVKRRDYEYIATVTRITPTGRITIDQSSYSFNNDGSQRGGDIWSRARLTEVTPEALQRIQDRRTVKKAVTLCRAVTPNNIDIETAKKLIALLDKGEA